MAVRIVENEKVGADIVGCLVMSSSVSSTVEKLRECCDDVKVQLGRRNNELEDMMLECRQFEQKTAEFERWVVQVEEDYESQKAVVGRTIPVLEELISANKVRLLRCLLLQF